MQAKALSRREFIILMAFMVALDAFSIDTMIPALAEIGADLALRNDNDRQYIITSLFLGFALGILAYGVVSDSAGRKKPIYVGFALYLIGTTLCAFANSLTMMLIGRVLQGVGAAGPYVLSTAIIRDLYSGQKMAEIMSFILMVFILIPAIAPLLGQGIIMIAHWRVIFVVLGVFAIATVIWFGLRQVETLPPERRVRFSGKQIMQSIKTVLSDRQTMGYTLALGFMFGAFIAFLSTVQQILQEQYLLSEKFPFYFSVLALAVGVASFFNARWVRKISMYYLVWRALIVLCISAFLFLAVFIWQDAPLWAFMLYMLLTYFCFGVLFGNFISMALESMGHNAGMAAALINCLSTAQGTLIGALIGSFYDNTVTPIVLGFGITSIIAMALLHWVRRSSIENQ